MLRQTQSLVDEAVEIGRVDATFAEDAKITVAHVIGNDLNDVRSRYREPLRVRLL